DARIFATAGWDSKARVYSTKTMMELAVLKWHKEGCYAVALGEIRGAEPTPTKVEGEPDTSDAAVADVVGGEVASTDAISTGEQRRTRATSETHWLAIGSKDGKLSLWEVY